MTYKSKIIFVSSERQEMHCYENDALFAVYPISTGAKGMGEKKDSFCTPRGWHRVHSIVGLEQEANSVFVARNWTGELYSEALAAEFPERDWILTRILRLEGLELGRNKGGEVDTFERCIYIHGTPDSTRLGHPGSRGCIRVRNKDVMQIANWSKTDTLVYIQ